MSPNLNAAIDNRTAAMQSWWRLPEYIKERKAFVKRRPICDRCGRPASTPGHSHEDYRDFETYLNAVKTDKCESLCSACNKMERSGRRPCPACVEKYARDPTVRIHYITRDQETCRYCEPGYDPERVKYLRESGRRMVNRINRKMYRKLHPGKEIVGGRWVEKKQEAMT